MPILEIFGDRSSTLSEWQASQLWNGVEVSVRVPSKDEIDMFKNYSYTLQYAVKIKLLKSNNTFRVLCIFVFLNSSKFIDLSTLDF